MQSDASLPDKPSDVGRTRITVQAVLGGWWQRRRERRCDCAQLAGGFGGLTRSRLFRGGLCMTKANSWRGHNTSLPPPPLKLLLAHSASLVLGVIEMLRKLKVVGKFVEFFGEGTPALSVTEWATTRKHNSESSATMDSLTGRGNSHQPAWRRL